MGSGALRAGGEFFGGRQNGQRSRVVKAEVKGAMALGRKDTGRGSTSHPIWLYRCKSR